jgi:hypothetical protein
MKFALTIALFSLAVSSVSALTVDESIVAPINHTQPTIPSNVDAHNPSDVAVLIDGLPLETPLVKSSATKKIKAEEELTHFGLNITEATKKLGSNKTKDEAEKVKISAAKGNLTKSVLKANANETAIEVVIPSIEVNETEKVQKLDLNKTKLVPAKDTVSPQAKNGTHIESIKSNIATVSNITSGLTLNKTKAENKGEVATKVLKQDEESKPLVDTHTSEGNITSPLSELSPKVADVPKSSGKVKDGNSTRRYNLRG